MRAPVLMAALLGLTLVAGPVAAEVARPFPPGFLWGTAISGFQTDMGVGAPNDTNSDWWVWVRDADNLAAARVSGDLPEAGPGFFDRFDADALRARVQLKTNAIRLSLEWSRLFPTSTAGVDASGGFTPSVLAALDALADPAAVARYREMLTAVRARHLVPMVTLNHFSLPLWVHEPIAIRNAFVGVGPLAGHVPPGLTRAGWLDPAIVDEFAKFAAWAGWKFGDLVDLWCTINEPIVILVSGYVNVGGVGGNFPPGVYNFSAVKTALPQLVTAHARAYDALHATDTVDADGDGTPVMAGIVHNMVAFQPTDAMNPLDVRGAQHADYLFNRAFLTAITSGGFDANLDGDTDDAGEQRADLAGRSDYIGVNYYLRATVIGAPASVTPLVPLFDFVPTISYATPQNPSAPPCPTVCTDFGWEIYPQGLREVLTFVGGLGLPVFITENGIADAADTMRPQYIYDHLSTLQQAITDGVADVRGYFHWALMDNFEWSSGYYPRFGLFGFDPGTGRLIRRRGARPFRVIARHDGIPVALSRRYGP